MGMSRSLLIVEQMLHVCCVYNNVCGSGFSVLYSMYIYYVFRAGEVDKVFTVVCFCLCCEIYFLRVYWCTGVIVWFVLCYHCSWVICPLHICINVWFYEGIYCYFDWNYLSFYVADDIFPHTIISVTSFSEWKNEWTDVSVPLRAKASYKIQVTLGNLCSEQF